MTTSLLLGLLLIATTATHTAQAAAGDGVNAFEYRVLCNLVNIAKLPTDTIKLPTVSEDTVLAVEVLNMSASNDDWKKNFPAEGQPDPEPAQPCTSGDERIRCSSKYSRYKQIKSTLAAETVARETKGKHNLFEGIQRTAAGQRAQLQLHDIATTAASLRQSFLTNPDYPSVNIADDIKHELRQALYGEQAKAANGDYKDQWSQGGTRSTDCKTTKAGKSLRGDLACLCIADNTQTKQACGNNIGPASGTAWSSVAVKSNIDGVESACAKMTKPKLTAATIREALEAFNHALRSNDAGGQDAIILGKAHTDGACGGAAGKACVDYTNTLAPKEPGEANSIPWYKHMSSAAKKLEQVEKAAIGSEKLNARLNDLKTQAESLYKTLKISEAKQVAQKHSPGSTLPVNEESKCKPQNTTAKECPSEHCDYDEQATDGKKCKPKPGSETTATGAGEGAAGANSEGKKCSDKKKEEDCKDGCKWDGKECKDSSILVNKQFALSVVSAAFVALLF